MNNPLTFRTIHKHYESYSTCFSVDNAKIGMIFLVCNT